MVENTARSASKPQYTPENEKRNSDSTIDTSLQSERENSLSKMSAEARGVSQDNDPRSLFEQVLKNDSATGAVDLRKVFNVAVTELDDNSPVKKYVTADQNGRNEVRKSIAADCMSTDEKQQMRGNELLKQIMYFEALANLNNTQGKTDEKSTTNRSYALHLLAGQERHSVGESDAGKLLAKLESCGDKNLKKEIESARKGKERDNTSLVPLAEKTLDQLLRGDLKAGRSLTELHLQQVGLGNLELSVIAQKSNEIIQEAEALSKRAGERTISVDDARPTAPREGKTPTGTLVLPEEGGTSFKQYDVKQGKIFAQNGEQAGSFQDDGSVSLKGYASFKIADNKGAAFHGTGTDGARLDLVANADKSKFTGFIATADSQEAFTVTCGNMYDASGKMIGKFNQDGQIETSENGATTWQSLNAFRADAIVVGEENGQKRSFEASASASDGHILIKDATTGKHVRHDVKMGMLINSKTGEQLGWVDPPSESADGKLSGGNISIKDKDGNVKKTTFSEQKDMIFSLQRVGVSGVEASPLQGMTTEKNGIFNIGEAKRLQLESKLNSKEVITAIKESESGIMGKINLKKWTGKNAADTAEHLKKIGINNSGYEDLDKLASGDQAAVAKVDTIKKTRDALHDVLKAKPADVKSVEAAPVIEIPTLDNAKVTASVNGHLRLGHQVFTIKNGDLYEAGKENQPPTGKLLPGYHAQFNDADKTRVVDLAKENRVLMKFTSNANSAPAHLIGMGEGHMTGGLGYQEGGLIDVRKLSENARRFEIEARKGNDEYFANRPYATGALGNWAMGDREALLKDFAQQLDRQVLKMNGSMQELFHFGFDPKETSTRKLDSAMLHTQAIMHVIGAQSADTTKMAAQGQQVQGQVNEAVVMATMTVATCGAGALVAGAANLGKVTLTARAAMAAEGLTCAGAGAIISGLGRASDRSHLGTNLAAGSIEGVMMFGGNQSAKLLSKMDEAAAALKVLKQSRQSAQQTLMKTAAETVKEAAPAMSLRVGSALSMGTGFSIAASMRNGEGAAAGLDVERIAFATVANLVGQYANARLGDVMGSKAVLGTARDTLNGKASVLGGIVRNTGDGFVNSGVEGGIRNIKEQRQGNPNGQLDFMAATWSALDSGAIGGATSMSLGGALRVAEFSAVNLANRYTALRANLNEGNNNSQKKSGSNSNTDNKAAPTEKRTAAANSDSANAQYKPSAEAVQLQMQPQGQRKNNNPTEPRKLETLWKGLRDAVEKNNAPRVADAPANPPRTPEPETTAQQRQEYELDFQRRVDAGEFTSRKAPVDNKPITDPVEISKKVIDKHIHDLKNNRANAGAEADTRRTELIKPEVYFDDSIGPRQLFTVATTAKVAINDSLKLVAKIGHGAAEDIANQSISIGPKQFGHTREVKAQLTLAKETQGDIDPSNMFVKTGPNRAEAIIGHVRNASQAMPETDYFATTKEIAGHRGMSRWMEQNEQRRAIQHEISKDYNKRSQEASEDSSKGLFLRRAPQEIAAATVAAKATQIKLESEISELTKAGQSTKQHQEALTKLQEFQKNLAKARQDAGYNPVFKAYFAELDAYMKKAFEN